MKLQNTANKKLIKRINTNAILNIIRTEKLISRADLSKILKLNPATISSNVADLLELGIIREKGSGDSSGGRKPIMLELNSSNVFVVGVHTELTKVNIGIVDINGKVILTKKYRYETIPENEDRNIILQKITDGIEDIIKSSKIDRKKIIGIGVGLHGLVNAATGESVFAPAFHWHHIFVKDLLYKKFEMPIIVDNDVRVMALGEKWFGGAKSSDNFILINVGQGIGGALFIDGNLFFGKSNGAGEIGHIKVTQRPYQCDCGNQGCLTTVASEEAILGFVKEMVENNEISIDDFDGDITLEKIVLAAKNGDKQIIRLFKKTGEYIGRGIGTMINILNPERIILTGSVLIASDYLIDSIVEGAKASSIIDNFSKTKISVADICDNLGVIGASTLILNNLFTL